MVTDRSERGLELYDALREIEAVEDDLHAEEHELADRLSDARHNLVRELINRAMETEDRQ